MPDHDRQPAEPNLAGLNQQIIKSLNREVEQLLSHEPGADLTPIFERHAQKYSQRKARRKANAMRSVLRDRTVEEHQHPLEVHARVIHPLDPTVLEFLDLLELEQSGTATNTTIMVQKIELALAKGRPLHPLHDLAVVQIHPSIVIKTHDGEDQTEIVALRHVEQHAQRIPVPQLLGALAYGGKTRIFMSFISGRPLKDVWASMLPEQKLTVRDQMADILSELRSLPLPSEYLGCGSPPICTDVRMSKHQSDPYIKNEAEFNDFLLSAPRRRISHTYLAFLKENCLGRNHTIVMTHGDFAPRNIIVETADEGAQIVGLVDWECAGAYPEYWEYLKSLNTFSSIENDDWYRYLPHAAIGRYTEEWAKNLVIEKAVQ